MITYDSSSILVSPSSKIIRFCWKIADHISLQGTQSRARYPITMLGYEVLVCIWFHQASNCTSSVIWTQSWIRVHNFGNSLVLKCVWIALSICHQQYNTWQQLGYVAQIAFTCAWSRSVMYMLGEMSGLCALIICKKCLIVIYVPLDDSIQAHIVCNCESCWHQGTRFQDVGMHPVEISFEYIERRHLRQDLNPLEADLHLKKGTTLERYCMGTRCI